MFPGLGGVGGTGVQRQGWCFQGAGESEVQASSGGGDVSRVRGSRRYRRPAARVMLPGGG